MNYIDAMFNLPREDVSHEVLRRELVVTSNKGFRGSILSEKCYDIDKKKGMVRVPIPWAIKKGLQGEDKTPYPQADWPEIDLQYRHNQKEVVEKTVEHILKNRCSRIKAGTGFGKSVVAIAMAMQLKTNCLIVVPTNEILEQFKATATDIFGIEPGVIKGKKQQLDKLVVVTTYQTLSGRLKKAHNKLETLGYEDSFGLLVIDEAHLCGCDSFRRILHSINSRYRLSVSADFYRADKLEGVYTIYLGEIAAIGKKDKTKTLERLLYTPTFTKAINPMQCLDRLGEFSHVEYLTKLAASPIYNKQLVSVIKEVLKTGGRRILVGMKRIEQATIIQDMLGDKICGKFMGGMKPAELEEAAKKPVICWTKSNLGFDISKFLGDEESKALDPLNTVIVAYPTKNSLQLIGRAGREFRGKPTLIIHPVIQNDFYSKSAFYKNYEKNYKNIKKITKITQ